MNIQVLRLNSSSYQDHNFLLQEKEALESLPGVSFTNAVNNLNAEDPIILISNTHTNFDTLSDQILEKTLLLIHPNSGHDNLSKSFLDKIDFPIIVGNAIRAHAVQEYILGCLFSHFSPVPHHSHWSSDRVWDRKLVRDQKILILGHGHIGQLLKNSLDTICPNVSVFDPFEESNPDINLSQDLTEKMVKNSTVVVVACNLNSTSEDLVSQNILKNLHSECLIINAARGGIINEADLTNYLQKNPKAKAFLDVFKNEPFTPGYFSELPNLNKTSHIAGVHKRLNRDIIQFEFHMIKQFLDHHVRNQEQSFLQDYSQCLLTQDNKHWSSTT